MTVKDLDKSAAIVANVTKYMGIKLFACFGTLLGIIRDDGVVPGDHDVDFGVLYEDFDEKVFVNGMSKWFYKLDRRCVNDVTGQAFHLSFTHATLPPVCIFAWYKQGRIRYHTFSETGKIPKEYVFRGVPEELFDRTESIFIKDKKKNVLTQRDISIPVMYGTLLDLWYPDWKTPRKAMSASPYVIKVKSCSELKHNHSKQLKASREEYDKLLCTL